MYLFSYSLFLGESNREEFFINFRFCKKKLAQVSSLGILLSLLQMGVIALVYQVGESGLWA